MKNVKTIKTFNEQYRNIVNDNVASISEKLIDDTTFDDFMTTEFIEMFEDVILNGTVILLLEGQNWNNVKGWLKDKWSDLKTAISDFIKKIGQVINSAVLGKFMSAIKEKFTEMSQEVLQLFDSMKIAVIKHNLILDSNKPNFKKITEYVMDIFKKEKTVDSSAISAIDSITSAASGLKTESLFINKDSLFINENLNFTNASLNEYFWNKKQVTTPTNTTPTTDSNIITFNSDEKNPEGKNITIEQLANTGIGIFTKLLLKIGVNNPRAQVALTKMGTIMMGVIVSAVIALVVSTGGLGVAVAGTAGWAFTGVAFSVITVIAGLFFAFGVFLLMCWFRKPYPSLEDYVEYLEAWFRLYPDGIRKEYTKNNNNNGENFKGGSGNSTGENWGKYDENRLNKDDTYTLLRKWNKLNKLTIKDEKTLQNIKNIEGHLIKRGLKPEEFEAKRLEYKKIKDAKKNRGEMISYKDEKTGKYRTGIKPTETKKQV